MLSMGSSNFSNTSDYVLIKYETGVTIRSRCKPPTCGLLILEELACIS